jgi:hypothetical protein
VKRSPGFHNVEGTGSREPFMSTTPTVPICGAGTGTGTGTVVHVVEMQCRYWYCSARCGSAIGNRFNLYQYPINWPVVDAPAQILRCRYCDTPEPPQPRITIAQLIHAADPADPADPCADKLTFLLHVQGSLRARLSEFTSNK